MAKHMADVGHNVTLWARREEHARSIQEDRENRQYLPGLKIPDNLSATSSIEEAIKGAQLVLSVVPSQKTRDVWEGAKAHLGESVPVLCASKGIENGSLEMMSEVLSAVMPGHPTGFVAGPSFAKEVAGHQPTAIVIGSKSDEVAKVAQEAISSDWMRAYISHDVVGLEVGGALKNVIAIACGCADGLGLGLNSRAAIITRGLAEITRIAVKLGADPLTLAGLGGMGDLVLTCTGDLSRNRRVGIGLGKGKRLEQILEEMGQIAEGVKTALSAKELSDREGIEMPITREVYRILYENRSAKEAVLALMRRSLKSERH